jgi:site-specific recombinase XerD
MKVINQTGSTLTKVAREQTLTQLRDFMKSEHMPHRLHEMASKHLERYIAAQKEAGVGDRTLQNRMSHIRSELAAIGRGKLADSERLSTQALGIGNASRDGTHRALSSEQYAQALEKAREASPGFAAALQLQRELGLRQSEAIQSVSSLRSWERALERGDRVHVLHGTKGGRTRDTLANDRDRALEAVKSAIEASKANEGRLIVSSTLEGARRAYNRFCHEVGMKGEHASHALRCSYAQERFELYMQSNGGDRREALAATSLDLGHGDGRGTYVAQVYLAKD